VAAILGEFFVPDLAAPRGAGREPQTIDIATHIVDEIAPMLGREIEVLVGRSPADINAVTPLMGTIEQFVRDSAEFDFAAIRHGISAEQLARLAQALPKISRFVRLVARELDIEADG
jgi:hypothetical protein